MFERVCGFVRSGYVSVCVAAVTVGAAVFGAGSVFAVDPDPLDPLTPLELGLTTQQFGALGQKYALSVQGILPTVIAIGLGIAITIALVKFVKEWWKLK